MKNDGVTSVFAEELPSVESYRSLCIFCGHFHASHVTQKDLCAREKSLKSVANLKWFSSSCMGGHS